MMDGRTTDGALLRCGLRGFSAALGVVDLAIGRPGPSDLAPAPERRSHPPPPRHRGAGERAIRISLRPSLIMTHTPGARQFSICVVCATARKQPADWTRVKVSISNPCSFPRSALSNVSNGNIDANYFLVVQQNNVRTFTVIRTVQNDALLQPLARTVVDPLWIKLSHQLLFLQLY